MRKAISANYHPAMTREALAALRNAGFSRRDFLKQSGALVVGFSIGGASVLGLQGGFETVGAQVLQGVTSGSPPANQVDSWIAIGADGGVTAYTGKQELGQGIVTAQTQLVAEELCVPLDRVNVVAADTASTPDEGYTSGSQSHPSNFNKNNLAGAGATARESLMKMGAARLGVAVEEVEAVNGEIRVKGNPAKKVGYGELVQGKKFNLMVDGKAKRKPASEWAVLGKPVPRLDIPALVTAQFEFVHNVRVPGMLHGRVVRPPCVGATVVSVDESSVQGMPGVVKVVRQKNFVGVVAEKPWQAIQAANKLKVAWSAGAGLPSQANFYEHVRNQKPTRDTMLVDSKDIEQKLASAATVVKATYYHPYQSHGSMGSSCAVADIQGEKGTIWSASQGVWYLRSTAEMILGMKPESLRVIFARGSGCYGHNGADTVSYDAAVMSQAVGKPVRVQLTRKDEMAWENYGFVFVMDDRAGLDAKGNIIAWDHEAWVPVLGNRPGPGTPGNVVTGMLLGFEPEEFAARTPAPDPTSYNNNSNAIPSYVTGCVGGTCEGMGTVRSERSLLHNVVSPFWTGPLRSPQRLQNTFAHESFMDELAAEAKADPVEYRVRHLSSARLRDAVNSAAKTAEWDTRPSPKPKAARTGVVTGRGIACVSYEGHNGISALVAEVEVNCDTGVVKVKRAVASVDCGPISNPDGLRNQTEGGALAGISRALGEEVTWDNEKVTSVDWRTYHTLPLGFEVPKIEVTLLNHPEEEATGAGELSITLSGAAIGNAIFDATGVRLREIPFTPQRVKAALTQVG